MSSDYAPRAARALAGVWGGAVLGGSLIAAPAKFQALSLTQAVALDVGRAQFYWLGIAEAVLCAGLLLSVHLSSRPRWAWPVAATTVFAVQRLLILPPLDERTLQVIAGQPIEPSSLHWVYIALEVAKLAILVVAALQTPQFTGQQPEKGSTPLSEDDATRLRPIRLPHPQTLGMDVLGIDFTSSPSRRKPITCLHCRLEGNELHAGQLQEWSDFKDFESALKQPGPWIAGIDFPFGQSREFIENIGWPATWQGYVQHTGSLERSVFRKALDSYRENRPAGSREHRRRTDVASGSISPQKLYGVPVGLMFFEGAPRLLSSGVTIPGLHTGDPERIAVEAYPGVLARQFIGRRSYKNDTKSKQTDEQHQARRDLFAEIVGGKLRERYGIIVHAKPTLCDDPGADHLDALLCAIQAAWAWRNRENSFGAPKDPDQLEGWIADPSLSDER